MAITIRELIFRINLTDNPDPDAPEPMSDQECCEDVATRALIKSYSDEVMTILQQQKER